MTRHVLLFLPFGLLAACGDDATVEQQPSDERTARGEVLGGTISDDMLPLDTRRSQSPPLREATSTRATASSNDAEPESADESTGDEG